MSNKRRDLHTFINQFACNGPLNKESHPFLAKHYGYRQLLVLCGMLFFPLLFLIGFILTFYLKCNVLWIIIITSFFLILYFLEIPLFIKINAQRGNTGALKIEGYSSYVSIFMLSLDVSLLMYGPSIFGTSLSKSLNKYIPGIEILILFTYICYLLKRDISLSDDVVKNNINNPYIRVRRNKFKKFKRGYYMNKVNNPKEDIVNLMNNKISENLSSTANTNLFNKVARSNANVLTNSVINSTANSADSLSSKVSLSINNSLRDSNSQCINDTQDREIKKFNNFLSSIDNKLRYVYNGIIIFIVLFALFILYKLF